MFLVCPGCSEWSIERLVADSMVVCDCGYRHPIALRPLLLVTGASRAGKTTIALRLAGTFTDAVVLDQDILWMLGWIRRRTTGGAFAVCGSSLP